MALQLFKLRHCNGMGSCPAPFLSKFLFVCLGRDLDIGPAEKRLATRSIDELNAMNNNGQCEHNFKHIYPRDFQLFRGEASSLKLKVTIDSIKFDVYLQEKRDAFLFQ